MEYKYEKGNITFKGLSISWNLYTTEKSEHGEYEVFNIKVEDDKQHKIRFDFKNSIMECGISKLSIELSTLREVKKEISRRYHWGGYDKVKNKPELSKERIRNLLYSILNCMANDSTIHSITFKEFCDCFGYDDSSLEHKKIYRKVLDQYDKLNSLNVNWSDWEYIAQEEDQFNDELNVLLKGD